LLDQALLRPPRFTEHCLVPLPDEQDRKALLVLHLRGCPVAPDLDLANVARNAEGYSGADMMYLCERAKLIPFRESVERNVERAVTAADFEAALQRVRPSVSPESMKRYQDWVPGQ
jgi:SpoVK/Ycf46/Vps4 family AAA+-type ATPase